MEEDRIVLIPAFEPDERLISLTKELSAYFKVIVVNDGSSNKYNYIFDRCLGHVISYEENMGKGFALKKGLRYIKENYKKYIICTMDCDGQHAIGDALKICEYASSHKNLLVLGSRRRGGKTPLRSLFGNSITRGVYFLSTGYDIYDTQTGLRAFSNYLIDYMLDVPGDRYEYEMNVLLYLKSNNIRIKEIDIEVIYIDNNKNSHFNTLKDSFKIYKEIFKYSLSSFVCFLIDYLSFVLFTLFSCNLIMSNILSRLISSIINYNLNKKAVFSSGGGSIISYYSLVCFSLIINSLFLSILSLFLNSYLAKIVVEVLMFFFNYYVQKYFVFKEARA